MAGTQTRTGASQRAQPSAKPVCPPLSQQHRELAVSYSIALPTMQLLVSIKSKAARNDILEKVASATEFRDCVIKPTERGVLKDINDSHLTIWPLKPPLNQPWQKVFLLAQVEAAGRELPHKITREARLDLLAEKYRIIGCLKRLLEAAA
jgi:hypothetical protein